MVYLIFMVDAQFYFLDKSKEQLAAVSSGYVCGIRGGAAS
jgi:hypothetical protein